MNEFYLLVLGSLGVWRITHLLVFESGPFRMFEKLRADLGRALECFYCCSLWVSAPFAFLLAGTWKERLLLWLALSAGAIVLERMTGEIPMTRYEEDHESTEENENELLRSR